MDIQEKDRLINKAADWLYEHLANSDRMPMSNWNKEFWRTAFIGYMRDDNK
jgi:hemerythrin